MRMLPVVLLGLALNRIVAASPSVEPTVAPAPAADNAIRVFVLAGQSNMEGQSVADLDVPDYNEGRGTLRWLWRDPAFRQEFAFLRTPGDDRAVRDNVRVRYQLGELTGPWVEAPGEWAALRRAQAAAAQRPEFAGTVAFVSTHEFVRRPEDSPNPGHGHHEFGNAETGLRVGVALGQAMVEFLERGKTALPSKGVKPTGHVTRTVDGWTVRVDDRLLAPPHDETGRRALRFLEGRLFDIQVVVPAGPLERLQRVVLVLDLSHGDLTAMQYHPSADWLAEHGYDTSLARCVHIPVAADLPTPRNIREQPWVVLHELAHAYHDQVLGFDDPRIREAYEAFRRSGHGEQALLYDGTRTRHYGLTDPKEFFAEMTEAFFGSNDFQPFNRAELQTDEPAICDLLESVWREEALATTQ